MRRTFKIVIDLFYWLLLLAFYVFAFYVDQNYKKDYLETKALLEECHVELFERSVNVARLEEMYSQCKSNKK